MNLIYDVLDWIKENKKLSAFIFGILAIIFLIVQANKHAEMKRKQELLEASKVEVEVVEKPKIEYVEGTDAYLMSMQDELRKSYGTSPKGFIWDLNGSAISLGDKSMSSEDVLYSYMRAISTLDFSTAQKFSRNAKVTESYEDFFSRETASMADYEESFKRNMYKEALTSMEIRGIENSATFAKNKTVYTIQVTMLDLTSKDFWYGEKEALFKDMYIYESEEDDSTKLELFLYDYILNYYKSDNAIKRTVTFDVTLERYPDIDSGWLVSIDKDIDDAAKYSSGTLVTRYMTEQFRQWVIDNRGRSNSSSSEPIGED